MANESKIVQSIRDALEQELRTKANEEIEKAKRRFENELKHEKDIIIGKILNRVEVLIKENTLGKDMQITVIFKNDKGE